MKMEEIMLAATRYGLLVLGVIVVAVFCFVCVEEKAAGQGSVEFRALAIAPIDDSLPT